MLGLSLGLTLGNPTLGAVGSASAYASHPAPPGYRWVFVTDNGARVTDNGIPVVDLVRTSNG